ncbi:MAG: histidinol-phosphate transaminase [Methylococcales bacterium]|jgi:histidinol-phosphate aminotransferase|nr:histidinol-phosphate transaminase [Methylococcales bacterium]MBT7410601.1 histidinol-phosphate transaminase [Methylococcales bacterium]
MRSFVTLATPAVQNLTPYTPGKPISELEREYNVSNIIKLASNENPLGPSPQVIKAIENEFSEIARYPDGNGFALKQKLAEKHQVSQDCLTLGNGSNDVLSLIAQGFLNHQTEAIYSQYAFAVYPIVIQTVGAIAKIAEAGEQNGLKFSHDLNNFSKLITPKTRVIFIANPNNPTGTWLDKSTLNSFLNSISQDIIVVIDEAYIEYVDEDQYPDSTQWLKKFPNLIVTRTFSKAYGLASFRIGYSISSPEIADVLNRVRQPFNVNSFAQVAAMAALEDQAYIQKSVELNRLGKKQLIDGFNDLSLKYIPSVGNFLCVDVYSSASRINEELLRLGIIVRPVANYGMPKHLRITIGHESDNQAVLNALHKVII